MRFARTWLLALFALSWMPGSAQADLTPLPRPKRPFDLTDGRIATPAKALTAAERLLRMGQAFGSAQPMSAQSLEPSTMLTARKPQLDPNTYVMFFGATWVSPVASTGVTNAPEGFAMFKPAQVQGSSGFTLTFNVAANRKVLVDCTIEDGPLNVTAFVGAGQSFSSSNTPATATDGHVMVAYPLSDKVRHFEIDFAVSATSAPWRAWTGCEITPVK